MLLLAICAGNLLSIVHYETAQKTTQTVIPAKTLVLEKGII